MLMRARQFSPHFTWAPISPSAFPVSTVQTPMSSSQRRCWSGHVVKRVGNQQMRDVEWGYCTLKLRESADGRLTYPRQHKEAGEVQRLSNRKLCSLASVPRAATSRSQGDAQPMTPPHTDGPRLPDRLTGEKQGKFLDTRLSREI